MCCTVVRCVSRCLAACFLGRKCSVRVASALQVRHLLRGSDGKPSVVRDQLPDGISHVTPANGNVFADLGFADAAERQAKLRLAHALNQPLAGRKLSQAEAAKVLGVTQPKVSALRNYKLAGFSVERLMNLLTALDQDVEIVIRRKPRSRKTGRISVVAAWKAGILKRVFVRAGKLSRPRHVPIRDDLYRTRGSGG